MNVKMKELLVQECMAVLATSHADQPHTSLMAYLLDEKEPLLYMVTHNDTRKHRNVVANAQVSLLVDSRDWQESSDRRNIRALTITGHVAMGCGTQQLSSIRERFIANHPHLAAFAMDPKAVFFMVRMRSLQLLEGATTMISEELEEVL